MLRKSSAPWLSGVLSTTIMLMGCATKKPISSAQTGFRFEATQQGTLLFSPNISNSQPDNAAVKLLLSGNTALQSVPSACSANSGSFRLEHARESLSSMVVVLPPPDVWLSDLEGRQQSDELDGMESLYAFLADLDRAQQAGCFADAQFFARLYVLQSIPMKPSESLFNAYGYRVGRSGLDLKPGLRLKIERAYFRSPSTGEEHSVNNYLGVSTVEMDVEQTKNGELRFQQIGDIKYSPDSLGKSTDGNQDGDLKDLPEGPNYRLLFYTYLVPKEYRVSAAIIGAGNAGRLDELEQQLRARPEEGCKTAGLEQGEKCFEFKGFVTLSTQINIELNGKPTFVDWGTKVSGVLRRDSLAGLRIQRQFMNSYYDVRFDPTKADVLSLALTGGDRLTWTKGKAIIH
jgi:hypothetical protein